MFHVEPPAPAAEGLADFDFPDDLADVAAPAPHPQEQVSSAAAAAAETAEATAADDDAPPDLCHSESYEGPDEDAPEAADTEPVKPGFSLDDVADLSLPGSGVSKERRRRVGIVVGAVALILAATVAAVYYLDLLPGRMSFKQSPTPPAAEAPAPAGAPEKAGTAAPEKPAAAQDAKKAEETAKVKDIMLQNVRQYYVSNEKAGQLFVIEGKAVNNFKTPKEMIKLEATLFDEKGGSLASQEELAGNTVSLFQLQVMTRDELKNALSSQVGVLTNNTNIASGGEAPFMVVFFDPPEAVKEFGVKVIDVKDPAHQ